MCIMVQRHQRRWSQVSAFSSVSCLNMNNPWKSWRFNNVDGGKDARLDSNVLFESAVISIPGLWLVLWLLYYNNTAVRFVSFKTHGAGKQSKIKK